MAMIDQTAIIIPALNPDYNLIDYVKAIIKVGGGNLHIIIINDGSSSDKQTIFEELENINECVVLHHAINLGKGRALKNAFNYYLINLSSKCNGVITVDSDGQHAISDVLKLAEALETDTQSLILGARNFNNENVPFKSKFGNKITKNIIQFFYGGRITDTQTGLRAIPNQLLYIYLPLMGERFEFETMMLIESLRQHIKLSEIKISTLYNDGNSGTHFRPIADSWAIYKLILGTFFKYSLSSLSSAIIDIGVFGLLSLTLSSAELSTKIWAASIGARIISSLYNFYINKTLVFPDKTPRKKALYKYYGLCITQLCCSAIGVYTLCRLALMPELLAKILVDGILFILSFQLQRNWVFRRVS